MTNWLELFHTHHDHAHRLVDELRRHGDKEAKTGSGLIAALLAIAAVERGQLRELTKIRRLLQQAHTDGTVRLNLTGTLVPKHGGLPMPAGPFTPSPTQDVDLQIAPTNAAGLPTTGPFTWAPAGRLTVAADTLSAKYVTPDGNFDDMVVVTDPRNGVSETAPIVRSEVPPDNATVAFNMTGQLVPKVAG